MLSLDGYKVIEVLSLSPKVGVWRALNLKTHKDVFLKTLVTDQPDQDEIARLKHEYRILKKLKIEPVIRALDFEESGRRNVLVLEYVPLAITLDDFLAKEKITTKQFLLIAIQLASALYALHSAQVIHKDINPRNMVLVNNKDHPLIKLINFGMATELSKESQVMHNTETLKGTLAYISPEQTGRMNRAVDHRTDLYSLGVTFYKMITGKLPFEAKDPAEWIHCHIAKQPPSIQSLNSDQPEMIAKIIMKLLSKDADHRYLTAYGLQKDLEYCLSKIQRHEPIDEFILGLNDREGVFSAPSKLYGRESEQRKLLDLFDKIKSGRKELLLVSGYSGVGKSSIINEIHKPIARHHAYYISGKFEQLKQNIPYFAIIQAFRDLIQQILASGIEQITQWRQIISNKLEENSQVIIEVIPELEMLLGKQPLLPDLGSVKAARDRFESTFFDFISLFSKPEHPLVLFLDDLQWANTSSLDFIKKILIHPELKYFLIIGAYRDNEVSENHPLNDMLREISKKNIVPNCLRLTPIDLKSLNELVVDSLNTTMNTAIIGLSTLIFEKTRGNPLFSIMFLNALYQGKYISFDSITKQWTWDLETIKMIPVMDNVADLLSASINKLPMNIQETIRIASCIGNKFDLKTLSLVCENPEDELAALLWEGIREGFIVPLSGDYNLVMDDSAFAHTSAKHMYYKFSHDQVQKSFYSTLSEQQIKEAHLKIGNILLKTNTTEEMQENIFDIVNHLNLGSTLISQDEDKYKLIKLNIKTALKAKISMAFESANEYIKIAIQLLTKNASLVDADLSWKIYFEQAEIENCLGNHNHAIELLKKLYDHSSKDIQKLQIVIRQVQIYTFLSKFDDAIETGLSLLNQFSSETIGSTPSTFKILTLLVKVIIAFRKRPLLTLEDAPLLSDKKLQAVANLRTQISTAALFSGKEQLFAAMTFQSVRDGLVYGFNSRTAADLGTYAFSLFVMFHNAKRAKKYIDVAIKIAEKYDHVEAKLVCYMASGGMLYPFSYSFIKCLNYLNKAYKLRKRLPGNVYIDFSITSISGMMFMAGFPLTTVMKKIKNTFGSFNAYQHNNDNITSTKLFMEIVFILCGKDSLRRYKSLFSEYLKAGTIDKETGEVIPEVYNGLGYRQTMLICLMKTAYFLEDWDKLLYLYFNPKLDMSNKFLASNYPRIVCFFYSSLAMLQLYDKALKKNKRIYKKQIDLAVKNLKQWSDDCPRNFLPMYDIVLMGVAAYINKNLKAVFPLYEQALTISKKYKMYHLSAIANELMAEIYLYFNEPKNALIYFKEALYDYQVWGCVVKLSSLTARIASLNKTCLLTTEDDSNRNASLTTSSRMIAQDNVKLSNTIKIARSISSYLKLDELLKYLITVFANNFKSERCVLLLAKDNKLWVEAEISEPNSEPFILQHQLLDHRKDMSKFIISSVETTSEPVLINDSSSNKIFSNDAYFEKNSDCSVLCYPFLYQNKLVGIIYLENKIALEQFDHADLEVLKMIASQVAVSITNAGYYSAYDQFVPHEFLDLLNKRSIIDIQLGDCIKKNMTVMFLSIKNFDELSSTLTKDELFNFLNDYFSIIEPIITNHRGFIDKYIGSTIMALFPENTDDSLLASLAIQQAIHDINKKNKNKNKIPEVGVGIGISCGSLMLGTLGGLHRMSTSVVSDVVNLASRLCELSKKGESHILISDAAHHAIEGSHAGYLFRFLGKVSIRGKQEEVPIWEEYSDELQLKES